MIQGDLQVEVWAVGASPWAAHKSPSVCESVCCVSFKLFVCFALTNLPLPQKLPPYKLRDAGPTWVQF